MSTSRYIMPPTDRGNKKPQTELRKLCQFNKIDVKLYLSEEIFSQAHMKTGESFFLLKTKWRVFLVTVIELYRLYTL